MAATVTLANYKKAVAGFVAVAIPLVGAVVAANVLTGPVAHDVSLALVGLTAVAAPLGVAISPKNGPKTDVLLDDITDLLGKADRIRGAVAPAVREIISEADAQEQRQAAVAGVDTASDPSQYPSQGAPS